MDNLNSLLLTALPREQLTLFPNFPLQRCVIHLTIVRTSGILSFHSPCLHAQARLYSSAFKSLPASS